MKLLNNLPTQIGVAVLLLGACLFIPLTSSLGQGITERVILSWRGLDNLTTGQTSLQIQYQGDPAVDLVLPTVSRNLFSVPLSSSLVATPIDNVAIIEALYKVHPHLVESLLGTYGNVESITNIFPHYPVAFPVSTLKTLGAMKVNPDLFGGPDIPPGSVPYAHLIGGVLHIDTLPDQNTLVQCAPGVLPYELVSLNHQVAGSGGAPA